MNGDGMFIDSIRQSFIRLGKNINHMSDEEVKQKGEIAGRLTKDIDFNNHREEYLKIVYEVFNV